MAIGTKNNKAKVSYNVQFYCKPAHARTQIYLTNELFEIPFIHVFLFSSEQNHHKTVLLLL